MKFRFTIGRKIGTGFGILILLTLIVFALTKNTLDSSREINNKIIKIHSPSVDKLQELKILILESKMLITNWVNEQSSPDDVRKQNLIELTISKYPSVKQQINEIAVNWSDKEKELITQVFAEIDTLFSLHEVIKSQLNSFEAYEDPFIKFTAMDMVEEGGEVDEQTEQVIWQLDDMILRQRINTNTESEQMIESFGDLEFAVIYFGLALVLGGILVAFLTIRTIVSPVQQLRRLLLLLGKGVIPEEKMKPRSDEIGEMSIALNDLVDGFKRTTDFAREVGSGNFESDYIPLSKEDTLGHSLIAMRKDLYELTSNLEQKVKERTEEVVRQKEEIENQKKEIEVLFKHVTDSIKYAKRIQEAILPPKEIVERILPNSFILYKPKDIVSGDFYWVNQKNGKTLFAAIDCTGHGVPGAFMTIVGRNALTQAIDSIEEPTPATVLDALNRAVSSTLHQGAGTAEVKDGMDAAMCAIDFETRKIEFAGAYNPFYLVRNGQIQQIKGDKFPIGAFLADEQKEFTNHEFQLREGDTIYIFSDGYADQFGGDRGKKFMYKQFRDLLVSIQDHDMKSQLDILDETIEEWRGDLEQVDDILIIGLRIN